MMNKNFSDLAKRITRVQHGLREPQLMHPNREWMIGVIIGIVLIGTSAVWSVAVYTEHEQVSIDSNRTPAEAVVVYRASLVEEALQQLEKRTEQYAQYRSESTKEPGEIGGGEQEAMEMETEVGTTTVEEISHENESEEEGTLREEVSPENDEEDQSATTSEVFLSE